MVKEGGFLVFLLKMFIMVDGINGTRIILKDPFFLFAFCV